MSPQQAELTYCRKVVFSTIALTVMIVSVYSNSFNCSWHFDDMPNIVENPLIHMDKLDWQSLNKALFSDRNNPHFPYRPVACLSFALNYYFGRLNVFGYHVVNLGIHLITAIFLFLFIYRTLLYLAFKKRWDGDAYFVALLATVLWAINPIQTQAVTYIVQRMASLAAMFYIIAMYCYLKARTIRVKHLKFIFFFLSALSFLLALASKENAAMLPVSIFLFEVLILQADPWQFLKRHWFGIGVVVSITGLIGTGYFLWKTGGPPNLTAGYQDRVFTLGQRLLTEPRVIIFYLTLLFYPMPYRLNICHDFPVSTSLLNPPTTFLAILAIIAMVIGGILLAKKKPFISFAVLFFLLNHLIESSVFPLELVFEHRNYLPSMFLFVPLAMGIWHLLGIYKNKKFMQAILCASLVLVLVGLGHSTFMRNFTWKNEISLWIDSVDKSPDMFRPHHNLAKAYSDAGQKGKALAEYLTALTKQCIAHKNEKYLTYYNLGNYFYSKGLYQEAEKYYKESISLERNFWSSHNNLGIILTINRRYNDALREFGVAAQLTKESEYPKSNLGFLLVNLGKYEKGIRELKEALAVKPENTQTMKRLGVAYLKAGRPDKAVSIFRKVLIQEKTKSKPHSLTIMFLAEAYYLSGREKRALNLMDKILTRIDTVSINKLVHNWETARDRLDKLIPDRAIILTILVKACERRAVKLREIANHCRTLRDNT